MAACQCTHGGVECGAEATFSLGILRRQGRLEPVPLCEHCARTSIPYALFHQIPPYIEMWISSGIDGRSPWAEFDDALARQTARITPKPAHDHFMQGACDPYPPR